jgi:hypothetical protein
MYCYVDGLKIEDMENEENIAGLGKNHDQAARDQDLAKKQSDAKPAAENLEMEPNSVNKDGSREFSNSSAETEGIANISNVHNKADEYAKQEHEKADNWENTNETGPDKPQF